MKNNLTRFEEHYNKGTMYFKIAYYFWMIETIVFLFVYGWHWRAASPLEIMCDVIAYIFFLEGFYNYAVVISSMIKFFIIMMREGMEQKLEMDKIIDALIKNDKN